MRLLLAMCVPPSSPLASAGDVLMQRTMKQEMGLDDTEVEERLTKLVTLLPGLLSKLPVIKAKVVITLAEDISVSTYHNMISLPTPLCDSAPV